MYLSVIYGAVSDYTKVGTYRFKQVFCFLPIKRFLIGRERLNAVDISIAKRKTYR